MFQQVRSTISRYGMLQAGDRVVVAVSGGPDSVALLHLLHRLAPELNLSLYVFHMEHGLRGQESENDARFVADLAACLHLPCRVTALPHGALKEQPGSLQANARSARQAAIAALAAEVGANRVAYGHNRDDQAETVLMRFLRGAGPRGLAGIPPVRAEGALLHIRPLLEVSRKEIEAYCTEHELFPRLDQSNLTPAYLRNRLRLELLPHLAATYNPAIRDALAQTAAVLREEDAFLDELAQAAYTRCRAPGEGIALLGSVLLAEPLALARRVVRQAARAACGPAYDLGLVGVTRVLEAAATAAGSNRLTLPGGLTVTAEYGICRFRSEQDAPLADPTEEWPVAASGTTAVPQWGLTLTASTEGVPTGLWEAAFDAAKLPGPLTLRRRRPGDRIWPTGMNGSKKVQDLLVDAKVPRTRRDHVPILAAGQEVLWVIGHRLDRRFLATPATKELLFLRIAVRSAEP